MISENTILNLERSNITCAKCNKTNLDNDPKCIDNLEHDINSEELKREIEPVFQSFVNNLIINSTDEENIGTVTSKNIIPENSSYEEVKNLLICDPCYRKIFKEQLPISSLIGLTKKNQDDTAKQNEILKSKRKNKNIDVLFFNDERLTRALSNVNSEKELEKNSSYNQFLDDKFIPIVDEIIKDELYIDYVMSFLGVKFTFDDIRDAYIDIISKKFLLGEIYDCFTYDIMLEIFSFHAFLIKLKEPACMSFFIDKIKKLKNLENLRYIEHINFLKHLIGVKILKKSGSSCYSPALANNFESEYMRNIIGGQTRAYNFCYDFDILNFLMIYKADFLQNEFYLLSKRNLIIENSEFRDVKNLLDFKNFFYRIKIGGEIVQVIYKKGEEILASQERTMKIDLSMGDFFAVYFRDGSTIIIDILTEEIFFKGTGKSIKNNIKIMNNFGIEFKDLKFVSFEGKINLVTSGILLKKILATFFNKIDDMKKYWYTKSQLTSTNNHSFVYWGENIKNIPSVIKESVDFNIVFVSKINIVLNKWEINFTGNQNSFIIPFFSMFFAMVHLMENIKYNPKYDIVKNTIEKYLLFHKKKSSENKKKNSDTTTILVSQNEIAKRETYNRAIKNSIGDANNMENFNSRSKPIVLEVERFKDPKIVKRWKTFYAHIMCMSSPIFSSDMDRIISTGRTEIENYANNNIIFDGESFSIEGFENVGILFKNRMFLSYPERGKLPQLEIKNQFPTKSSVINIAEGKVFVQKFQGLSSRKKNVSPAVQQVIDYYTSQRPSKSGFYFPKKRDFISFKDFVENNYPNAGERHALLYQHMWDYTPDEIEKSFNEINMTIHQDLLQDYHKATIIFFVYDTVKKVLEYVEPRNRFGYYRNVTYNKVMFIFKMSQDRMDVIYFEDSDTIDLDEKIRNYIKFNGATQEPLTAIQVINMLEADERIYGQFFDTNGKSIGIRVKKNNDIMDLRYDAQFAIFEQTMIHNFGKLTDTQTNVNEKFGNFKDDKRFTLVPKVQKKNKYDVMKIHQETKNWRRDVYFFTRTLITYWMILNPDSTKTYDNFQVEEFVDEMIEISDGREMKDQIIDHLVVLQYYTDISKYSAYLEKIYPNRFYNGKFHVNKSEFFKIKDYMKMEIILIKNCPLTFRENYLYSRVESSVLNKDNNVIEGINSVFYNNMLSSMKEKNISEDRFIFMPNFSPTLDFNHTDHHLRMKKAEMVLIPFRGKYYIIRMTEKGYFSIAVHVCNLWFKKKEIASYYTTEERNISSARKFRFEMDEIIESNDNEEDIIKLSGEDYWILSYNLKSGAITYAAMLPVDIR